MRNRFDLLDGLRGVAAIVVVVHHALSPFLPFSLSPFATGQGPTHFASLAVDFFFCLSGFVVAYAYEEQLRRGMSFVEFCARRIVRLYPLILLGLVLGAVVFIARFYLQRSWTDLLPMLGAGMINATTLPSSLLLGPNDEGWPLNPPQWSLLSEFAASFVFAAVLWRLSTRNLALLAFLCAALVVWMVQQTGTVMAGNKWSGAWWGAVRVAYPFVAGVLLWRIWQWRQSSGWLMRGPGAVGMLTGLLLLALLAPIPSEWNRTFEVLVVLVGFPALVYLAASVQLSGRMLRVAGALGAISYPIYVLHYPFVRAAAGFLRVKGEIASSVQFAAVASVVVVSVVTAWVALCFYDEPLRAVLARRWLPRRAL